MGTTTTEHARLRSRQRRRSCRIIGTLFATGVASVARRADARSRRIKPRRAENASIAVVPFAEMSSPWGDGTLITVDPGSTLDSAPLFSLLRTPLNLTWGQWKSASGSSGARTGHEGDRLHELQDHDDRTDPERRVLLGKPGLRRGRLYPLIALTVRFPKYHKPEAVADERVRILGRLLDAQSLQVAVIYASYGKTCGPVPTAGEAINNCRASFGIDSMRQSLIIHT
jgi:hypothetical protein